MNKQTGFTLIELVMVIVIIGILAAMAVPRFVDLETSAVDAAKEGTVAAVRTAFATAAAQAGGYPTVAEIAANVQLGDGDGSTSATAANTGVQVTIQGTTYTVLTYTDPTCGTATGATTARVQCVGAINP